MTTKKNTTKSSVKKTRNRPNPYDQDMKPGDRGRYLRFALDNYFKEPIQLDNIQQVKDRVIDYFERCVDSDIRPTISGLCLSLGITRETWASWGRGSVRTKEYSDLVKSTKELMHSMYESYMVENKVNPVSCIFLLKNHFGYQDKQEIVVEPPKITGENITTEELREKYLESAGIDMEVVEISKESVKVK